jgi:hypothetical protein
MQSKRSLQELSRLRSALGRLLKDLRVEVAFARTPLVKGNVYEMARKCGKPSCVCSRGDLHCSMVLSWSDQGKTRLLSIPAERLAELRSKSEAYLRFRRARAEVSKIHKEMLLLLDRIEELRREAP